jgi:Fur family ferric uptake transcriptional regulator
MASPPVAERLRAAGERVTAQRLAVAETLATSRRPQSAEQLWRRLRAGHGEIGRATVFRSLEALVGAGVARRFEPEGHASTYFACRAGHHHHLVCTGCGDVEEVNEALVLPLVEGMRAASGFEVDDARIDFYGRCARCAAKDAPGS